jgi:hypothetical protein
LWARRRCRVGTLLSDCPRFGERLEYQILLAHDLKLILSGRYEELSQEITEIKRMLTVLVQKLTADR